MLPTRPISAGLLAPPPFDPPRLIQEAMGGREFFFGIGARTVHRIGLLLGLGFRIPFGEARDHIDLIKIIIETVGYGVPGPTFTMEFRKCLRFDADGLAGTESDLIRSVAHVPLDQLRSVYEQNTGESK